MSCQICCDNLNKIRKVVSCPLCNKVCCSKCFGKYLLDSQIEPYCMFCQGGLTMDFVYENTTKIFMNEYKEYRFQKKFELEKSRLPDTQEEAFRTKFERDRIYQLERSYAEERIILAQKHLCVIEVTHLEKDKSKKDVEEKQRALSKLEDIKLAVVEKQQQIWHLRRSTYDKKDKKTFIKKCPDVDCRGFLSTNYKCGICEKYFCSDCNEIKKGRTDEEHTCNADLKATYDLLKKDSKPCPNCSCMIYKIDGCSQMWCVHCHTAFDWNTGMIEKGYVHNPEYFRYLRENDINIPRNPNERCGNFHIPQIVEIRRSVGLNAFLWSGWYDYVMHVRHFIILNATQGRQNFLRADYSTLRVSYLLGEMNEEEWKKTLRMTMKRDELNTERYLILDMYCNVMSDIFIQFITNKELDVFHTSCRGLFEYTNSQMVKAQTKFKSKDTRFILDKKDKRIALYFDKDFINVELNAFSV